MTGVVSGTRAAAPAPDVSPSGKFSRLYDTSSFLWYEWHTAVLYVYSMMLDEAVFPQKDTPIPRLLVGFGWQTTDPYS